MNMLSPPGLPSSKSKSSLMGKLILLVDQDKALLATLSRELRREGARVLSGGSVSEAITCLSMNYGSLDLVLTGMRMPVSSGKCILSAIKGSDVDGPVIVMSAIVSDEVRGACAALGAFAFLEKPVQTATLIGIVRRAAVTCSSKGERSVRAAASRPPRLPFSANEAQDGCCGI